MYLNLKVNRYHTLILLSLVLFSLNSAYAQEKQLLTKELKAVYLKDSLPGMSVALVNPKGIIYSKSFGFADIRKRKRYKVSTIQNIGSVSKTIISLALMKAVELGYFTLETDINSILPFQVINPNNPHGIITVRHLSNHTSGIIDNEKIYNNSYQFYPQLREYDDAAFEMVKSLGYRSGIQEPSMGDFLHSYLATNGRYYNIDNFGKGSPGSVSSYSNIGSALAAYLIELKAGMSFDNFTRKYILSPLHMNHSAWLIKDVNLNHHAKLYADPKSELPLYDLLTYADGGFKSSVKDLSNYVSALVRMQDGDTTLLHAASVKEMFTPQFSEGNLPKNISLKNRNKGIFWNLYTNGTIGHDGDDPGISAFVFFNPQTRIGGIMLTNMYVADKSKITDILVKAASGFH